MQRGSPHRAAAGRGGPPRRTCRQEKRRVGRLGTLTFAAARWHAPVPGRDSHAPGGWERVRDTSSRPLPRHRGAPARVGAQRT